MLRILLADDDKDDCFFFRKALDELPFNLHLDIVRDGEQLMNHLYNESTILPDILYLDLNMPRKNGAECLVEIKSHPNLKQIPVVIYSTCLNEKDADELYKNGAHFYMKKTDLMELIKRLHFVLSLYLDNKFQRPNRKGFIINMEEPFTKSPTVGFSL